MGTVATVLFILYCLEAGVFFILAPWTRFWSLHPILHATPFMADLFESLYVRGLVSGFGLVHLLIGFREIGRILRRSPEIPPSESREESS